MSTITHKVWMVIKFVFWTIPNLLLLLIQMFLYALFLAPSFTRLTWFYFVASDRIVERYQTKSARQCLDIYGSTMPLETTTTTTTTTRQQPQPDNEPAIEMSEPLLAGECPIRSNQQKKPVLVFFPGGAWIIGYKMWGAFLARTMVHFGILIFIVDYRNFPVGTITDMLQDTRDALAWVKQNCARYGGDPDRMVALGQSAGGHLVTTSMLLDALQQQSNEEEEESSVFDFKRDLRGVAALSAPYDLSIVGPFFERKGVDGDIIGRWIFENRRDEFDPLRLVLRNNDTEQTTTMLAQRLPPFCILHGTKDGPVPYTTAGAMHTALRERWGVEDIKFVLYRGWSHTDPILEALMEGDHRFHRDLLQLLGQWTHHTVEFDSTLPVCQPMNPSFLIQAARFCNAFQ